MNAVGKHQIPSENDIPMHGWQPYGDFHRERVRAHAKHNAAGGSMEVISWDSPWWLPVVVEEVGEVAHAMTYDALSVDQLRTELVQVGAMVSAWIDAIDDRNRG